MKYRVQHRTSYEYRHQVDLSHHELRLTPRALPHQRVLEVNVSSRPRHATASDRVDYFGNTVTYLAVAEPHRRFAVEMSAVVEVRFPPAPDPLVTPGWEGLRRAIADGEGGDCIAAGEFAQDSPRAAFLPAMQDYAAASFPPGRTVLAGALDLSHRIHQDFTFAAGATEITTPVAEVLQNRRGVCQDFAHVMLSGMRSLGLAARYVSGYIRTHRQDGLDLASSDLVGRDASHAWVSVFCGGQGWVDLDPTNDLIVEEEHIVLGWGRDYGDVSPIRGIMLGGGEHTLDVAVGVRPLP